MLVHLAPRADEFVALLAKRLPERTLRHSISVANFIGGIAEQAGVDRDDAITAGLLHDMFKATKAHELLAAAERYEIPITPIQREKPMLLHGAVAAEEARRNLGVTSDGVYEAMFWHTTGRAGLGRVGLALYFCDFAEPLRTMPESAEARARLASDGFIPALLYVAERKVEHVRAKYTVDPATEAFFGWLQQEYR
ncbi:MAG: HD domain-containing protein [Candidatus Hydrogenedentes bacterium]|nr:HD domain-containing protein [Candidatus Hydrogenedentota bacterium]